VPVATVMATPSIASADFTGLGNNEEINLTNSDDEEEKKEGETKDASQDNKFESQDDFDDAKGDNGYDSTPSYDT